MEEDFTLDIPIPDFLNEDADTIHKRMIDSAPSDVNTIEGDFFWDNTRPTAEEHAYMTQIKLQNLLKIAFLQTTYGYYLDGKSEPEDVYRKSATKAYGVVTIEGDYGTLIPKGTIVSTISTDFKEAVEFEVVNEYMIGENGICKADIEAVTAGASGKVLKGNISVLVTYINGIRSITNEEDLKGGSDEESDESLKKRVFNKKRNPSTSGNKNHYKEWALEVNGVGDCKVYDADDLGEAGKVKVVIINDEHKGANQELISNVYNYIQNMRPAGANVVVESAIERNINISVRVILANGYMIEEIINDIKISITKFLYQNAFQNSYVSVARIGNLILNSKGVFDYSDFTVNNATNNINLADNEVPVLGNVTVVI